MNVRKRLKRLIAILLAITMVLTDISLFQDPTEVKAANDDNCHCHTSLKPHKVDGSSIASWAQGSGKNTILGWHESTATSKTAHIISFNGTYYLAWFQRNKTATSTAHYHTDGYHLTAGLYTDHSLSIKGSNPNARIMEGEGFQQAYIGIVSGSPSEHYTLYYVDYDKVVDMCQALGLASKGSGTATYYEAYMQPYISCYDGSGTRRLNKGETYDLVYNMFCRLYSYPTQRDLIEKYNVKLRIPAIVLPVKIRIRSLGAADARSELTYRADGSARVIETNVPVIVHREQVNGGLTYSVTANLQDVITELSNHIRPKLELYGRGGADNPIA